MKLVLLAGLALVALAGCANRNIDSLDAVKQGVIRDLGKNINVGAMDVNVVSVSFRDREADAVVSFAPKGGTAAQGLTMNYTLERQGSEWHIKKRAQADLERHAAQAQPGSVGATPDAQQPPAQQPQAQLPPGHPPLAGAGSAQGKQLPPGHPPLDGGGNGR